MTDVKTYRSYRDLPTLAGLATLEEAAKPGLSVEACVSRLKRYHYAFVRLHEIFTARITAEPIYELKTAFAHHAYLCAEHVSALRQRIGEMREPPLGLEEVPHEALAIFFDEILAAPTTEALLLWIPRGGAQARQCDQSILLRYKPAGGCAVGARPPLCPDGN